MLWPIHAKQVPLDFRIFFESLVDASRLAQKIGIKGANDNARVLWSFTMQAYEVFSVDREDGSPMTGGKRQNFIVRYGLFSFAGFQDGQDVMSPSPQFLHDRKRKILIGIEPCHRLRRLIFLNLPFNFFPMRANISPGIR